jgi:hypothetical protein
MYDLTKYDIVLITGVIYGVFYYLSKVRTYRALVILSAGAAQLLFLAINPDSFELAIEYYLTAALCDLFSISLLSSFKPSKITVDLMLIAFTSMIFNALGYALYMLYVTPDIYDNAMLVLAVAQVFRYFLGRGDDERILAGSIWSSLIRRVSRKGLVFDKGSGS